MDDPGRRTHRAGQSIVDLCRACKTERDHTVIAVGGDGRAARVQCGFCGSQHNYRGGGEPGAGPAAGRPGLFADRSHTAAARLAAPARPPADPRTVPPSHPPLPSHPPPPANRLAGHEGTTAMSSIEETHDLEALLRRVVREELGLTPGLPAPKWRGGQVVLRPGKPGLQEKTWPVDALFHKVVMIRNRLRTLEQQLNAAEIPEDLKLRLQAYVTACYGSLTSFNVLFADEADQFRGAGGDD
jgi:hypothetical protein